MDSQINFSKELQSSFGNMTSEEKHINKGDLNAYKNYDKKHYSMVPGLTMNNYHHFQKDFKKGGAIQSMLYGSTRAGGGGTGFSQQSALNKSSDNIRGLKNYSSVAFN